MELLRLSQRQATQIRDFPRVKTQETHAKYNRMCNRITRINKISGRSQPAFIPLSALLAFIPGFFSGINLSSRLAVSGGSCPKRSIRLQEVCALYRILPRPFDYISRSLSSLSFSLPLSPPFPRPLSCSS